jgi:hypothetical protein
MPSEREHASLDFARKEWAIWEAKACELHAQVDALTARLAEVERERSSMAMEAEAERHAATQLEKERDTFAGIVERVRKMVEDALHAAHERAGQVCCGRPGQECCGAPNPEWGEADTAIMDTLAPIYRALNPAPEVRDA